MADKASENDGATRGKNKIVIVTTSDWTVIPLENLVAQSDRIIAAVKDTHEANSRFTSWKRASGAFS